MHSEVFVCSTAEIGAFFKMFANQHVMLAAALMYKGRGHLQTVPQHGDTVRLLLVLVLQVTTRLRELHTTIEAGERHRNAVLQQIAFNLEEWTTKVRLHTEPVIHAWCKYTGGAQRGKG